MIILISLYIFHIHSFIVIALNIMFVLRLAILYNTVLSSLFYFFKVTDKFMIDSSFILYLYINIFLLIR